jgi:hypothetical protein
MGADFSVHSNHRSLKRTDVRPQLVRLGGFPPREYRYGGILLLISADPHSLHSGGNAQLFLGTFRLGTIFAHAPDVRFAHLASYLWGDFRLGLNVNGFFDGGCDEFCEVLANCSGYIPSILFRFD